jgi:hypothetical protein
MSGPVPASGDARRLRVISVSLIALLILAAIGIIIAFTANPHFVFDLASGTAWAGE